MIATLISGRIYRLFILAALTLLVACQGNAPVATVVATEPVSAETTQTDAEPPAETTQAEPTVVIVEDTAAATEPPPATATPQPVVEPTDISGEDTVIVEEPTPDPNAPIVYTDYVDELLGVRLQRPVDWTPQFPVRNEITSYGNSEAVEREPQISFGTLQYDLIGRVEPGESPDVSLMLLNYLQQNRSGSITADDIVRVDLKEFPAALYRGVLDYDDGSQVIETQWIIYNNPNLYRVATTAQIAPDGDDYQAELQQMISSLEFTRPSTLRGTLQFGRYQPYISENLFYTSALNGIAFTYPPEAYVIDEEGEVTIASDNALLDGFDEGETGYLVAYRELGEDSAEPTVELAESIIKLPETSARQVDSTTVGLDRYFAEAIMLRNRPDNRFTYELAVYVIEKEDGQAAIVSIKFGESAPAIWNEGVIGSLQFGP